MNKEVVHLVATVLWGLYGIIAGAIGLIDHDFSSYVMVTIVTAIAGNSAHLVSMALSKSGLQVTSKQ